MRNRACQPLPITGPLSPTGQQAGDIQLYIRFSLKETIGLQRASKNLEHYISDIRKCLIQNKQKINDSKTEMLVITTPMHYKHILHENPRLKVGNEQIKPFTIVQNLGAYLDSTMCMLPHVNNLVKQSLSSLTHLWDTTSSKKKSVNSVTFSPVFDHPLDKLIEYYSDWNRLKRSVACTSTGCQEEVDLMPQSH